MFPYYTFREDVEIAPGCRSSPGSATRQSSATSSGSTASALELWDALIEAGTPAGMKVIGMVCLDLFRIEGGFIIGGVEYDETVSPYECGLGWSVDLDKDDFQGRDGCVRDRDATTLRLTSVVLEGGGDTPRAARRS